MAEHRFVLNGEPITVKAPAEMPLVWVLRDVLNLTGTKYGCGRGLCRSCTVLVDGRAQPSCLLAVGRVRGEVTTIEGVAKDERHPVLEAWEAEQVPQCGWCQPGQILEATALLRAHPSPTDAQVDDAMRTHLCRCGTYGRIKKAIARAARPLSVDVDGDPGAR
jgi:aerobic-type carbon monoxide dehydrogenase small subunit (CoxS/CutS family)